jgi:hypothetical protein
MTGSTLIFSSSELLDSAPLLDSIAEPTDDKLTKFADDKELAEPSLEFRTTFEEELASDEILSTLDLFEELDAETFVESPLPTSACSAFHSLKSSSICET